MNNGNVTLKKPLNRVQNTSNTIHWSFNSGDPSPVDIIVVNGYNATLNGPFSIAQFVDTSTMVRVALRLARLEAHVRHTARVSPSPMSP